jgi:hypothetical protein
MISGPAEISDLRTATCCSKQAVNNNVTKPGKRAILKASSENGLHSLISFISVTCMVRRMQCS